MAAQGGSKLMDKLQTAIFDTEKLGELFMDVRHQKVECDRQRQGLREALTALRKSSQLNTWVLRPGGVMVRSSSDRARATLEQDQKDNEALLAQLQAEEKRLTGLLGAQGATPERVGPGLLNAMLKLQDKGRHPTDQYDPQELD